MTTITPRATTRRPVGRRLLVLALVLLATVTGAFLPSVAAHADTITWGITPASADGADDRISVRATLDPGAVYTDYVEVSNLSPRDLTFTLTAADGVVTEAGDFDVLADGSSSQKAGRWIDVSPTIDVAARASVVVPFTVTVPADATPGDHPAGIVAALAPGEAAGEGVDFVARTGVRLHLRVAGDLAPALTPQITALDYSPSWNPFSPGELTVHWEAENTGNVRLGGAPALTVSAAGGLFGEPETLVVDDFRELLPSGTRTGSVTVDAWPLFVLDADLEITPRVVGEDEVSGPLPALAASATTLAIPWVPLALLVLVLALIIVGILRRRARRRRAKAAHPAPVMSPAGEPAASDSPKLHPVSTR